MKIIPAFEQYIESEGWTIVCESPLELSHDDGSFASLQAAKLALAQLHVEFLEENPSYKDPVVDSLAEQGEKIDELIRINEKIQGYIAKALAQQSIDDDIEKEGGYAAEAYKLWDLSYSLVFSDHISHRVRELCNELNIDFDYCDPDTSYEEDVRAYADALNDKVSSLVELTTENTHSLKMRY